MKYQKFIIEQYKGIAEPIEINIEKSDEPPIIPIIGTNESGKSTVLYGCFAFDHRNDKYDNQIKHLTECDLNLYKPENTQTPVIKAIIQINRSIIKRFIEINKPKQLKGKITIANRKIIEKLESYLEVFKDNSDEITMEVSRSLVNRKNEFFGYTIEEFQSYYEYDKFIKYFIEIIPPIIYFDDFKDSIPKTIYFDPHKKFEIQQDDEDS